MAGRDSERAAISAFFASLIDEADAVEHTSLYISGSPGTGKTALVNSVLRALDVNEVKVITINCMALNSVDTLWERLTEELGATAAKKRKTAGRPKKQLAKDAVDALLAVLPTKWFVVDRCFIDPKLISSPVLLFWTSWTTLHPLLNPSPLCSPSLPPVPPLCASWE
jgi:cell division control protein 6